MEMIKRIAGPEPVFNRKFVGTELDLLDFLNMALTEVKRDPDKARANRLYRAILAEARQHAFKIE